MSTSNPNEPPAAQRPSLLPAVDTQGATPDTRVLADLTQEAARVKRRKTAAALGIGALALAAVGAGYWNHRDAAALETQLAAPSPAPVSAPEGLIASAPIDTAPADAVSQTGVPPSVEAVAAGAAALGAVVAAGAGAARQDAHPLAAVAPSPETPGKTQGSKASKSAAGAKGKSIARAKPAAKPQRTAKSKTPVRNGSDTASRTARKKPDPDTDLLAAMLRRSSDQTQASMSANAAPRALRVEKEAP